MNERFSTRPEWFRFYLEPCLDALSHVRLCAQELVSGLASFGVRLNPQQTSVLRVDIDTKRTGRISLTDFMSSVQVDGYLFFFH